MFGQSSGLSFAPLVARSNALVADDQVDLPAYHIHYDIHSWDYKRKPSLYTFDVYRDGPDKSLRLSQSTNSSNYTLVVAHDMWVKHSGIMALRLMEFSYAFSKPVYAYNWARRRQEVPRFVRVDVAARKLSCGSTSASLELCFDENTGLIASARIGGQQIRYDRWIPVGSRFIPGIIQMSLGKLLLFDAEATAFSPGE